MKPATVDIDIDEIIEVYPGEPEYLIFLLQDIQSAFGYISPEAMDLVCDHSGVPLSQAYAVTTFYQAFSLEPQGEHTIKVCLGTACHLQGAPRLVEGLERDFGILPGQTTDDLKFSMETVNCLGACALAPVIVADEEPKPSMTSRKMKKLINQLKND